MLCRRSSGKIVEARIYESWTKSAITATVSYGPIISKIILNPLKTITKDKRITNFALALLMWTMIGELSRLLEFQIRDFVVGVEVRLGKFNLKVSIKMLKFTGLKVGVGIKGGVRG